MASRHGRCDLHGSRRIGKVVSIDASQACTVESVHTRDVDRGAGRLMSSYRQKVFCGCTTNTRPMLEAPYLVALFEFREL